MSVGTRSVGKLCCYAAIFCVMSISSARGQTSSNQPSAYVDDWTHHHLVFSNPGAFTDAARNSTIEQWFRITNEPRFQLQQLKRSNTQRALAAAPDFAARMAIVNAQPEAKKPKPPGNDPIKKDWSENLGRANAATSVTITFSANPVSDCNGVLSEITIAGTSYILYGQGSTCWNTNYNRTYTVSGMNVLIGTTLAQTLQNLAVAVNQSGTCGYTETGSNGYDNICYHAGTAVQTLDSAAYTSTSITLTAKTAGSTPDGNSSYGWNNVSVNSGNTETGASFSPATGTLTGGGPATVQPNAFPAFYGASFSTASCSDLIVYPTGQQGSAAAANIMAFDNLYVGTGTGTCESSLPTVYWAYNTGAGEMVTTSPILSMDGKQVAFMESNGTTASLVLIKWYAESGETVSTPLTLTNQTSAANYHTCTPSAGTPCMYTMAFGNGKGDTISAPFYDAAGDNIYVGDDNGYLHKFTTVFTGSPAEAGSPWPVQLNTTAGTKISSPVFDAIDGNAFVGDSTGVLYSVTAGGSKNGNTTSLGDIIADAPLVDGSAGTVYAFVTTSSKSFSGDNALYQFPASFAGYGTPGVKSFGTGGAGYYIYSGTFDNVYFENSQPTGNLYVLGNTGVAGGLTLYQQAINNSSLGNTTTISSALTFSGTGDERGWPSPLSEICEGSCGLNTGGTATASGSTDYLLFSANRGATGLGCSGTAGTGCVFSYNISTPTNVTLSGVDTTNITTPSTNGCWATGGIVIDNIATTTGASQMYFVNLSGATAGGWGGSVTSSQCTAGGTPTITAVQTSQN